MGHLIHLSYRSLNLKPSKQVLHKLFGSWLLKKFLQTKQSSRLGLKFLQV